MWGADFHGNEVMCGSPLQSNHVSQTTINSRCRSFQSACMALRRVRNLITLPKWVQTSTRVLNKELAFSMRIAPESRRHSSLHVDGSLLAAIGNRHKLEGMCLLRTRVGGSKRRHETMTRRPVVLSNSVWE